MGLCGLPSSRSAQPAPCRHAAHACSSRVRTRNLNPTNPHLPSSLTSPCAWVAQAVLARAAPGRQKAPRDAKASANSMLSTGRSPQEVLLESLTVSIVSSPRLAQNDPSPSPHLTSSLTSPCAWWAQAAHSAFFSAPYTIDLLLKARAWGVGEPLWSSGL
jgi:hypothetical protein